MKNKLLIVLVVLLVLMSFPISASAEIGLKPVADPWDDPNNLIPDGETYTAYNDDGYIVAWETPECSLDGKYMLIENDARLTVEYRVSYMGDIPWGHVVVNDDEGEFGAWVLMSDLLTADGKPAASSPTQVPEHPTIPDPTPEPEPTVTPDPEATPTPAVPERPAQAINIGNTYNAAIVYTSIAIAAVAIAFAIVVLLKHKALNKKGE